jgi:hypothetical protein
MRIKEENRLIEQIAARASSMYKTYGIKINAEFIASELKIVHNEICQLRLQELLDADAEDFAHDIAGIHQHINIIDASFREGFSPRFAK